ncbi:ribose-phosphate pyrophosphokinase [Ralstonia pseudosolanacearum]|uniref:ribose-phosphate diphosphokinase n=1 Tax=Ralstonia nicotianae (strain ATCC BAA-1114 / GMI1000) TaxID=267608 RepID=Q8Y2X9_RALN1|nr:ribose-phosphate pyrophosphokinase [Ralstonia pseudosolanacearum]AST25904.1 phosphoribosylpyrophosphate synthetase [Ralstonia pseudosolanacearum]MCQ4679519.1 ribose-phosphate pyrophosphokinase [Ralstonia pseudosolanacearum]MDC6286590.1 ribose-phosphate pyrophosphokinase [Ralstonia pseudosolanacearum]CAD13730.1 probable ribose-phosphate pyrophosphokinase protein [Ralstonia pseudosolanacearum GMI1000]
MGPLTPACTVNGNAQRRVVLALPGNQAAAARLAAPLAAEIGQAEMKRFPDGEFHVRLQTPVCDAEVAIVCTLDRPDEKVLPLLWLAIAAHQGGARRVGLVAPYLAYMRQDAIFQSGEICAARHFAELLTRYFDWLVAVDPHLHRIPELSDIYGMPVTVAQAAPAMAAWVRAHVSDPLFIGPDDESRQWVEHVAGLCSAPWTVLSKTRYSAWDVAVSAIGSNPRSQHTPVLIDDIISTGRTLIAAAHQLHSAGLRRPLCVAVHAVFATDAYSELSAVAADVITCDTIAHPSNRIALSEPVAAAISTMFDLPLPAAIQRLAR